MISSRIGGGGKGREEKGKKTQGDLKGLLGERGVRGEDVYKFCDKAIAQRDPLLIQTGSVVEPPPPFSPSY